MRYLPLETVYRLAHRALANGGQRRSLAHVHWDISSQCEAPHELVLVGRPYVDKPDRRQPMTVTLSVRCKKCERCLRLRRWSWANRAQEEMRLASRTWFGTFTLEPEWRDRMFARAGRRLLGRKTETGWTGRNIYSLSPVEQFAEIHREISREFTLMFKRIRKGGSLVPKWNAEAREYRLSPAPPAKLRYLLVTEAHKDGFPHYHALVHEVAVPITARVLSAHWKLGFTNFELVDSSTGDNRKAVNYVTKYLTKSNEARVRASLRYGKINALEA